LVEGRDKRPRSGLRKSCKQDPSVKKVDESGNR
jgi:hypothetical protein